MWRAFGLDACDVFGGLAVLGSLCLSMVTLTVLALTTACRMPVAVLWIVFSSLAALAILLLVDDEPESKGSVCSKCGHGGK